MTFVLLHSFSYNDIILTLAYYEGKNMDIYNGKYKILKASELNSDDVLQALDLDKTTYPESFILQPQICVDYFNKNNQIYIMIKSGEIVVGYLNFSPIDRASYEQIKTGKSIDVFLSKDNIVSYDEESDLPYYGYFSSIVVKKEYRHQGLASILMEELALEIALLAKKGIWFEKIIADVLSDGGAFFCKELGMKGLSSSQHNSSVYEMKMIPVQFERTMLNAPFYDLYQRRITR